MHKNVDVAKGALKELGFMLRFIQDRLELLDINADAKFQVHKVKVDLINIEYMLDTIRSSMR
jgi:hypothetical protein